MNPYYTANTGFVVFAMLIMLMAVNFNTVLDRERKTITRVLFLVISVAALCEWLGNALDNAPEKYIWLHWLVKYIELCSAPYLGLLCGRSLANNTRWEKAVWAVVSFHVVLETISLFTGQIWYVDAQNVYHHGQVYFVYVLFYVFGVAYYMLQGLQTFWRFQQNGGIMVLLVTVFLAAGIIVSMWDNDVEITWLVVGISAIMLYKFYGDILQQMDGLTELGNRWSFEDYLRRYHGSGVILFFDVDHFKMINDTFGHAVGDKCLCTVADGLRAVYGLNGRCFRVGGDEFCVVLRRNLDKVEQMNAEFEAWQKENAEPNQPVAQVSIGWEAFDTTEETLEEAFNRADQAMYQAKHARHAAQQSTEGPTKS